MNFQQLRYVRAAVLHNFNLTEVGTRLCTSQSGVSKQIRDLETELGIDIFVRRGKRLVGLTNAGAHAADVIERILQKTENLKCLSAQFLAQDEGRLTIAATHNQASYVLPSVLARFTRKFPSVKVELRQGIPRYVADMLLSGEADIGIATEGLDDFGDLLTVNCFDWDHVVIVPEGHPLSQLFAPTLEDISAYPLITYSQDFSGGPAVLGKFEQAGIVPDIRLTAMDADVIKTYVRLGMGVGIVAQMSMANGGSDGLIVLPQPERLFPHSSTKAAVLKGSLLRNFAYDLIDLLAPHADRAALMAGKPSARGGMAVANFTDRLDLHFDWSRVGSNAALHASYDDLSALVP